MPEGNTLQFAERVCLGLADWPMIGLSIANLALALTSVALMLAGLIYLARRL